MSSAVALAVLLPLLAPSRAFAQAGGPTTNVDGEAPPPAPSAANAGPPSAGPPTAAVAAASSKSPTGAAPRIPAGGFELDRATTWDLDIEGAIGRYFGSSDRWTGLVRARGGVLFVRDPVYDSIGATFECSSLSKATFGIQVEVSRIDAGFWAQAGALLDVTARPGAMLSGGWSIFGLEGQVRSYAGLGFGVTVFAKVSIPIGIVAHVLGTRTLAVSSHVP